MEETHKPIEESNVAHLHINIFINGKKYVAPQPAMTGGEIKTLGAIPPDYQLFLETPGPDPDIGIQDNKKVELKSGMRFYGVVPGNLG